MYGIYYQMTLLVVLVLIILLKCLSLLYITLFLRSMHSTLHVLVCPCSMLKQI